MSLKEIAVRRSDLFLVDPRKLKVEEGFNVRLPSSELTAHIRTLANSIKAVGVRVPLVVRMVGDEPYVVHGHCRLAATKLAISEGADIQAVPVLPEERNSSQEDRAFSMIVSNEGKPLSIFEKAEVYKRLIGWGWTEEGIAEKSGKSITHVKSCLTLAAAPSELKNLVLEGKVAATLAIKLINEFGAEEALKQMKGAVQTAETVGKKKATEKHVGKGGGGTGLPRDLADKKVNWKTWGPKLHHALEAIVTCPAKGKGSENLGDYLAQGNEIIQQMEDEGYSWKS